jgi:hypothetical protein
VVKGRKGGIDLGGDGRLVQGERLGQDVHHLGGAVGVVQGEDHRVPHRAPLSRQPPQQVLELVALQVAQRRVLVLRAGKGCQRSSGWHLPMQGAAS